MHKILFISLLTIVLARQSFAAVAFGSTKEELTKLYGLPIKDAVTWQAKVVGSGEIVQFAILTFGAKTPLGETMEVECTLEGTTCTLVDLRKYDKSHNWQSLIKLR